MKKVYLIGIAKSYDGGISYNMVLSGLNHYKTEHEADVDINLHMQLPQEKDTIMMIVPAYINVSK